jgi:hypothetical protein
MKRKIMRTKVKLKETLWGAVIILLTNGITGVSLAQGIGEDLSPKDILQRVRLAYASLSTYRDTGYAVQQYKGSSWTNAFTELLGTRTCYRVEVITAAHPFSETKRFWSDGLDSYQQQGTPQIFSHMDLRGNLSSVAEDTALPAIYFNLSWGNIFVPLSLGPEAELVRKPDENIGNVSCFVVARTTPAYPATLWFGKEDSLIRRCETNGRIETHENISTNEIFRREDYIPESLRGHP